MRLAVAAALLLLSAVDASASSSQLRAASGAQPAALPLCDAVLCLPKRKLFTRRDYCSAPHSVKRLACVTPVVPAGGGGEPGRGAATTMAAFCTAAANVELIVGGQPPATPVLGHNDPDYRGERRWCRAKPGVALPPKFVVEAILASAPLPPWVKDAGPVSNKEAAGQTVAAFYSSVYTPAAAAAEEAANAAAMALPCEVLAGGAGTVLTLALPPGESCGPLATAPAVTMAGWRASTSIACTAPSTLTIRVVASATETKGLIKPISNAAPSSKSCFRAGSGLASGGPWPAVAVRLASARLRDAADAALPQAEWDATAALVRAAIKSSGGVPRVLRPFVHWFMATDPAFWAGAGLPEAGLVAGRSVRAFFERGLPTAMEAVLGADCVEHTYTSATLAKALKDESDYMASPEYLACKATTSEKQTAEQKAACRKVSSTKLGFLKKWEADFPQEALARDAGLYPDTVQPCKSGVQLWKDVVRLGWAPASIPITSESNVPKLPARERAALFTFEDVFAPTAVSGSITRSGPGQAALVPNAAPERASDGHARAAVYFGFTAAYASIIRVGTAILKARELSTRTGSGFLYIQSEPPKFMAHGSEMSVADYALLGVWQKFSSARVGQAAERFDAVAARWKAALAPLTAARPELLPYVVQHDPRHASVEVLTQSLVAPPSVYGPSWTPLYEKQCDSEFSARMDDWLAYSPPGVGALTVFEVVMAQGIRLAVEASPLPPAAGLVLNDLSFVDPTTACRSRLTRTDLDKLGERVTAELDKLTGGATYQPSFL